MSGDACRPRFQDRGTAHGKGGVDQGPQVEWVLIGLLIIGPCCVVLTGR
jgi:hypothetical protein